MIHFPDLICRSVHYCRIRVLGLHVGFTWCDASHMHVTSCSIQTNSNLFIVMELFFQFNCVVTLSHFNINHTCTLCVCVCVCVCVHVRSSDGVSLSFIFCYVLKIKKESCFLFSKFIIDKNIFLTLHTCSLSHTLVFRK